MCSVPVVAVPGADRAHIRNLFLRLLGVIFLIAFLSLLSQVTLLFGRQGLLPARNYLSAVRASGARLRVPTIFWLDGSDAALRGAAALGAVLSCGLILDLAPLYCLIALWVIYLSFASIGQDFLSFQWDNLLLESAFFSLFLTPASVRPKDPAPPHPVAVFLILWLVFRLLFESGAAKLLSGDSTWRDLTALATYYETAPLPTWVGWYAQQMPLWAHKLCTLFVYLVELGLPFCIWGPRRLRTVAFCLAVGMQAAIILTANYGFFNYLTIALCLFILDDGHLHGLARRVGLSLRAPPARSSSRGKTLVLSAIAAALVVVSVVPFLPLLRPPRRLARMVAPVYEVLATVRSINAYHLFAEMTLVRREAVIEGTSDGVTWIPYEFRYKPGDPKRAPAFVAPHQPRVDFQLWFLLLGGRIGARYFRTLLLRLFDAPRVVAPLFLRDPFPDSPPRYLRVAIYRYRFTDFATRRATGAWWTRDLLGYSERLSRESFAVR
jgi:lipase maturation factor 1